MASQKRTGKPATAAARRRAARERLAAERAAEARRRLRRRIATWIAAGVAAVVLIAGGVWLAVSGGGGHRQAATVSGKAVALWPRPADTTARARAEGLSVAGMEGTARHFHVHLDVLVNGRPVTVPAELGIASDDSQVAELHTHDTTGVLHIEAPTTNKRYTLGELFTEWNVPLSSGEIGGLAADGTHTLAAYVGGKKWSGDPAAIPLTPHEEIALVYGPANGKVTVPAHYDFPDGL